jgi:3',5'-cyclic AMP phosphodiesterase CpdA
MPTFQYISDIHLEFGAPPPTIPPAADVLLLAGDIGDPSHPTYAAFLQRVSCSFRQVFVITGNHEYYGPRTMADTEELIRSICSALPNVIFLQNEARQVLDTDIWIYGTTLWTNIPDDPAVHARIKSSIADYRRIKGFSPQVSADLFAAAVSGFAVARASTPAARQWIVLCHHQPAMDLVDPKFRSYGTLNLAFASDAPTLAGPATAVVYGHTHAPYQNGKFYCNPVGYPGERPNPQYDLTFSLPPP